MQFLGDAEVTHTLARGTLRFKDKGGAFEVAQEAVEDVKAALAEHDKAAIEAVESGKYTPAGLSATLATTRNKVVAAAKSGKGERARQQLVGLQKKNAASGTPGKDAMPSESEANLIRQQIAGANDPTQLVQQHADDPTVMAVVANSHPLTLGIAKDRHKQLVEHARPKLDP